MARVILNNETHTVFNNVNVEVLGGVGTENVLIGGSSSSVSIAQSIERVDLNGKVEDFTYQAAGNQVNVLRGGSVIATVTPKEGAGTVVRFADGSAVLKVSALGSATLGSAAIGTTAVAVTVASVGSLDAGNKSESPVGGIPGTTPPPAQTFSLTTGLDNLTGTGVDDTFVARIIDNSNTAQSADKVAGGAGSDLLSMDIGTSQRFAITLETTSIERVSVRAQANPFDTNNNNMFPDSVQLDAQRMDGVTAWESSNSRSDVVIEDVRILPSQITKDITIAMVETDPGNVDFGVYFDQYSLRNDTAASSQLTLEVLDTRSASANPPGPPLKDSPYRGFKFTATEGGVSKVYNLQSDAINDAQTYAQLAAAFQVELDKAFTPGLLIATVGDTFKVYDTRSGVLVEGQQIKITTNSSIAFSTPGDSGWQASGTVPANSGLHTDFAAGPPTVSRVPVTSKIILDDVGRGSTGGDLVVGGLSVGDTSTSKGVERFEIEVRDNSKLQTINSTNNTLQEVSIVNGVTTNQGFAYVATVKDSGTLTVNGSVDGNAVGTGENLALPGTAAQHNAFGFSDVRLIDASKMSGKLTFTAEFSERALAKYLNLVDTAGPKADTVAVVYTGGSGADNMTVTLDAKAVASNSNINVGREDFSFSFNGGAGNDIINVAVDRSLLLSGGSQAWYSNKSDNDNITINGGDGDDTIRTPGAGDMNILGGAGNDTIYADNTGVQRIDALNATGLPVVPVLSTTSKAVFVFNTADQSDDNPSQNLYDLLGAPRSTVGSYGTTVEVTFKGLTSRVIALQDTIDYKLSDLEVNQGIKSAINGDAVLSKLLSAADGPSGTLVVTSLIDGVMNADDLTVNLTANIPSGPASAAILQAYQAANPGQTVADIRANIGNMSSRYQTQMANDAVGDSIDGRDSVTTSDNLIDGGADNDVIVLGTTQGGDGTTSLDDSNDTVLFSGAFGNDVIVNFAARGLDEGGDTLVLRGIMEAAVTAVAFTALGDAVDNANGAITIGGVDPVTLIGPATTVAAVKALYSDDTGAGGVSKGLYISVVGGKGSVYKIADGAAASDLAVTLVGSIDLAATSWDALGIANFA